MAFGVFIVRVGILVNEGIFPLFLSLINNMFNCRFFIIVLEFHIKIFTIKAGARIYPFFIYPVAVYHPAAEDKDADQEKEKYRN